jgi:hypothetical protein
MCGDTYILYFYNISIYGVSNSIVVHVYYVAGISAVIVSMTCQTEYWISTTYSYLSMIS